MKLLKTSLIVLLAIVTVFGALPNQATTLEAAGPAGPGVPFFQVGNLAAEFQINGCASGDISLNTTLLLDPNTNYGLAMWLAERDGSTPTRRAFQFASEGTVQPFPVQLTAHDTSDYSFVGDNIQLPNGSTLNDAGDFPLSERRQRFTVEIINLDTNQSSNVTVNFQCSTGNIRLDLSSVNNNAPQPIIWPAVANG